MADVILLCTVLLFGIISFNAQATDDNNPPSTELLEFLGEWETREGEWFNPLWILKNMSSVQTKNTRTEEDNIDE